jgi:TP53 regulating kinase and related kinases
MQEIGSGAEAVIYKEGQIVIKHRIKKSYRHSKLDLTLRKSRTKREAKVLAKLEELNFPSPKPIHTDNKEMKISMDFIEGEKLRDVLEVKHCKEIGKLIAKLHENNIIHGDLTTSNMIVNKKINFIDFGLSSFSTKIEDKAVDLHLLRQALESKHHLIWENCFKEVLKGYKIYEEYDKVLERLEAVEARGRNKHKG